MVSEADARAWVDAYGRAWVTQDPAAIIRLFTPDARYQERRFRAPMVGLVSIRSYWQDLVHDLQRDVHFEPQQVAVTGDQAFVHWHAHFSWRPINGILELDAVSRVTFARMGPEGLLLASAFEEWIETREG